MLKLKYSRTGGVIPPVKPFVQLSLTTCLTKTCYPVLFFVRLSSVVSGQHVDFADEAGGVALMHALITATRDQNVEERKVFMKVGALDRLLLRYTFCLWTIALAIVHFETLYFW